VEVDMSFLKTGNTAFSFEILSLLGFFSVIYLFAKNCIEQKTAKMVLVYSVT
jgi:hypothetical protein